MLYISMFKAKNVSPTVLLAYTNHIVLHPILVLINSDFFPVIFLCFNPGASFYFLISILKL